MFIVKVLYLSFQFKIKVRAQFAMADGGKKAGSFSDPSTVSSARPIYIIFRDIVELLRTPGSPNTL